MRKESKKTKYCHGLCLSFTACAKSKNTWVILQLFTLTVSVLCVLCSEIGPHDSCQGIVSIKFIYYIWYKKMDLLSRSWVTLQLVHTSNVWRRSTLFMTSEESHLLLPNHCPRTVSTLGREREWRQAQMSWNHLKQA